MVKDGNGAFEGSDADAPEVGLGLALRTANNAFYRRLRDELAKEGMSFSGFQHLRQLWLEDGLTQVELAGRIGIGRASSTSIIDGLEQSGFIRRHRSPNDRRAYNVHLTEAGRNLEPLLWACASRVNGVARRGLKAEEVALLYAVLDRLTENLTSDEKAERFND